MSTQLVIDFEGGLTVQFPEWRDVVRAAVYDCGRPFKAVAADLDMRASELSRKLANNPADPVHFPLDRFAELLSVTGDLRPVHWLCEKYLQDARARQAQDIAQLHQVLRQVGPLLARLDAEAGQ